MQGFPMDSHVTWTTDPQTGAHMPVFDRAVTSEPLREYIKGVITNGVLPNPSTNLQVSAGANGMTVVVQAGFCVIEGGLAIEPNTRTLEVTAADSTYDRIDTVVARWDANDASRKVDLHIRAGVPASSPVRPTLTREGSIYELGLADVFVTKNVATITNEKITDTRYESARCGICSSIAEWDTTTIYQQVQADLAGFKTNEQAEFLAWFDRMKDQLSKDAAGHLQSEIDVVNVAISGLSSTKQNKEDNTLDTTAKTIVGAINEHEADITQINSDLSELHRKTVYQNTYSTTTLTFNQILYNAYTNLLASDKFASLTESEKRSLKLDLSGSIFMLSYLDDNDMIFSVANSDSASMSVRSIHLNSGVATFDIWAINTSSTTHTDVSNNPIGSARTVLFYV